MRIDLGRLNVEKLIVHEIPVRLRREIIGSFVMSEIESDLTTELKNYFREKIAASLSTAAYDAEFEPDSPSPVPQLVFDNLGSQNKDFVQMSREMAQHLFECQTGVNSSGLLTVVQTSVARRRSLTILKLEKEAAVRVQQVRLQGRLTFNMQHLRDLMLGERTKVFKVGLFLQEGSTIETIKGAVSDKQRGYEPTIEIADFFLKRFLGCKLREAPDISTKRFFETSEEFINGEIQNPETRARYQIALLSELNSELGYIDPRRFARDHLQIDDRQNYIRYLEVEGLAAQRFEKDTALIKPHLRRMEILFQGGIALIASPEQYEEYIHMEPAAEGRTKVEIEDKIKEIKGRR